MTYRTTITVEDLRQVGAEAVDLTRAGIDNRDRGRAPLGVVVHTPSRLFAAKARDAFLAANGRAPTPDELDSTAAMRFDVAEYQPHALIGLTGRIFLLDADHQRASHAGALGQGCPEAGIYGSMRWVDWAKPSDGSGWVKHRRSGREVYDWWFRAFPQASSPVAVFPWGSSPNDALGVDLLPDPDSGNYNAAQVEAFGRLIRLWSVAHGFPIGPTRVTTHSYAAPCERGAVRVAGQILGRHWDPDSRVWPHTEIVGRLA